jgi:hypothetical protein
MCVKLSNEPLVHPPLPARGPQGWRGNGDAAIAKSWLIGHAPVLAPRMERAIRCHKTSDRASALRAESPIAWVDCMCYSRSPRSGSQPSESTACWGRLTGGALTDLPFRAIIVGFAEHVLRFSLFFKNLQPISVGVWRC